MGAGTAFLTGFVDAANQSRYEKRMAAHEESIQEKMKKKQQPELTN